MKSIFTNRNIKVYTTINPLKVYIWSILLYGCECWTLTKDLERRLEAAEMWYIRRIMRISWTEKIPTQNIRKRLQFFGHINRADGLEKQILSGKICGTKSRGRQRTKYIVQTVWIISQQEKNLPSTSSSGELTTERVGRPWLPMSATDLAHDDDDATIALPQAMLCRLAYPVVPVPP